MEHPNILIELHGTDRPEGIAAVTQGNLESAVAKALQRLDRVCLLAWGRGAQGGHDAILAASGNLRLGR